MPVAGSCSGWGGSKYRTFDGTNYSFRGNCTHVLVREIQPRFGNLSVLLNSYYCAAAAAPASCPRALVIRYGPTEVTLSTSTDASGREQSLVRVGRPAARRAVGRPDPPGGACGGRPWGAHALPAEELPKGHAGPVPAPPPPGPCRRTGCRESHRGKGRLQLRASGDPAGPRAEHPRFGLGAAEERSPVALVTAPNASADPV